MSEFSWTFTESWGRSPAAETDPTDPAAPGELSTACEQGASAYSREGRWTGELHLERREN